MGVGPRPPVVYKAKVVRNEDGVVEFQGPQISMQLKPPEDDLSYFPVHAKFLVTFDPSSHQD